jgi:hypothetical protein
LLGEDGGGSGKAERDEDCGGGAHGRAG